MVTTNSIEKIDLAVAVIGAGAAGAVTAMRLLNRGAGLEVLLIDPRVGQGRGVAYGTNDPRHRLNTAAGQMSVSDDDPLDFSQWLGVAPDEYVARARFGDYLADRLDEAARRSASNLRRIHATVAGLDARPAGVTLELAPRTTVDVDAAVLAIGSFAPDCRWAPTQLRESARFVTDPWTAHDPAPGDVLLVGTGLTMVDMALSLPDDNRIVHAVSRHGLLPQAHASGPRTRCPSPEITGLTTLPAVRRAILRQVVRAGGDWRSAMDSMRPVIPSLWAQLSPADRQLFLRRDRRLWDVHRHRMPRQSALEIDALRAVDRLVLHTGEIVGVDELADGLLVTLSSGETMKVGTVVNCTGTHEDVGTAGDPLVDQLIATGQARPGPLGLGLDTAPDGRLLPGGAPLWTIGAQRRGNLWETTAFPEIRQQAGVVVDSVLGTRKPRRTARPTPRQHDQFGLPLSTTDEAARAYRRGLHRILCVQQDAEQAMSDAVAADPGFALGHAAMALLLQENGDWQAAAESFGRARTTAGRATDRERSFIAAIEGGGLLRHIATYPRDALAVSVVVPTIAFGGIVAGRDSWQIVEDLQPEYGDNWWYLGQLAFVRQDQGRWLEAASLAERALAHEPSSGHAVHATTHVYYETGEHEAGLSWLDGWLADRGPRARYRAHFAWHAGLHELALGDCAAVRRRYAGELAPPAVNGARALVDSAAFLWRCAVTGAWHGHVPIEPVLAAAPPGWLDQPPTAFAAMHAAMALAAAGDVTRLQRLKTFAAAQPDACFARTVTSLCAGLAAVVDEQWDTAVAHLGRLGTIDDLGGSKAQREVVEDTLIHAQMAAGRNEDAAGLLSARLDRRQSRLDQSRLTRARPSLTPTR